jgi:hypothetical protein
MVSKDLKGDCRDLLRLSNPETKERKENPTSGEPVVETSLEHVPSEIRVQHQHCNSRLCFKLVYERKICYTPEELHSERSEALLFRMLVMFISNYRNKITVRGVSKLV